MFLKIKIGKLLKMFRNTSFSCNDHIAFNDINKLLSKALTKKNQKTLCIFMSVYTFISLNFCCGEQKITEFVKFRGKDVNEIKM